MLKPDNIYYVGTLQDMGMPYVSLYLDKEENQLYLFVRISKTLRPTGSYVVSKVSPEDVQQYMREQVGLTTLLKDTHLYASITDNKISFESVAHFQPNEKMYRLNYFNPELCEDEIWMETFIDEFSNNLQQIS